LKLSGNGRRGEMKENNGGGEFKYERRYIGMGCGSVIEHLPSNTKKGRKASYMISRNEVYFLEMGRYVIVTGTLGSLLEASPETVEPSVKTRPAYMHARSARTHTHTHS
jgi:hypothetical protein